MDRLTSSTGSTLLGQRAVALLTAGACGRGATSLRVRRYAILFRGGNGRSTAAKGHVPPSLRGQRADGTVLLGAWFVLMERWAPSPDCAGLPSCPEGCGAVIDCASL
jgi:hypothetical protein